MARIKMHILKAKLPFYPSYEVKCRLQNGVSTILRVYHNFRAILSIFTSFICPLELGEHTTRLNKQKI